MADTAPPLEATTEEAAFQAEHDRVLCRRTKLEVDKTRHDPTVERDKSVTTGIALSGGGIRSATFSLGLLRALGSGGAIPWFDYLSTVSGGGYIGAFLCGCYVPDEARGDIEQKTILKAPVEGNDDPFSGPEGKRRIEHLRQSGRYLLPNSTGDAVRLMVVAVRSWIGVHLVIGLTLLALIMSAKLVQALYLSWDRALNIEADLALRFGLPPLLWPSQWMQGYAIGHWVIASWLWLISAPLALVTAGLFWSFFLTRTTSEFKSRLARTLLGPSTVVGLLGIGAGLALALFPDTFGPGLAAPVGVGVVLAVLSAIAVIGYMTAELVDFIETGQQLRVIGDALSRLAVEQNVDAADLADAKPDSPSVQEDRVRRLVTDWATLWLKWSLFFAALALFDTIAQTIFVRREELLGYSAAGIASIAAIPIVRQVLMRVTGVHKASAPWLALFARFGRTIALLAGLLLCFMLGIFWALIAQALAWRTGPIGSVANLPDSYDQPALWVMAATVAALLVTSLCIGFSFGFLNLSSFAAYYAARLRRAYLGASNRQRRQPDRKPFPINLDHINDDIALNRYYGDDVWAPLHLINVTINDTKSGSSNTVQRDQRGKPLVVSSAGFLYPEDRSTRLRRLAFSGDGSRMPEKLPLSAWIGISGAAASTGMGHAGSLGLSLLAGLANVRLGIWWDPGRADQRRLKNFVQGRLAAEFLGRFPGTDGRRWYLTDGGHFENTAAYELIRRKVSFILLSDNGADPEYEFADLVSLIRRIRIDFNAELTFAGEKALRALLADDSQLQAAFGSVRELAGAQQKDKRIGPYAALGRIRWLDEPDRDPSTLLLVKPRVCGHEAPDLVAYAKANPSFPQQTTLDQFFDEAQWESYFRLGQGIGETLFKPAASGEWSPSQMEPISRDAWESLTDITD